MWKKVELDPRKGLFLMNNGFYIYPDKNINEDNKDKIIGYCLDNYRIISINSGENPIPWSTRHDKVLGLIYYKYEDGSTELYRDLDGKYNTNCIIEFCKRNNIDLQSNYPAFDYVKSFSPGYKDGEWYLPSARELKLFYDNREKFRSDCNTSGISTNMNSDTTGAYYFWTSTEYSGSHAWFLNFNGSVPFLRYRKYYYGLYVVPFLKIL